MMNDSDQIAVDVLLYGAGFAMITNDGIKRIPRSEIFNPNREDDTVALIKFDKETFIQSMEPGIVSLVMQQFQDKLEEKLNEAVEATYNELLASLPEDIKGKIYRAMEPHEDIGRIRVEVDLTVNKSGPYQAFKTGDFRGDSNK